MDHPQIKAPKSEGCRAHPGCRAQKTELMQAEPSSEGCQAQKAAELIQAAEHRRLSSSEDRAHAGRAELRRPSTAGRDQKAAELRRLPSSEGRAQKVAELSRPRPEGCRVQKAAELIQAVELREPSSEGRAERMQAELRRLSSLKGCQAQKAAELTSEGRPRRLYVAAMPCSSLTAPCFTYRPRHDISIRDHTLLRLSTPHHSQECTALRATSKLWLCAISFHDGNGPSTATHYFTRPRPIVTVIH